MYIIVWKISSREPWIEFDSKGYIMKFYDKDDAIESAENNYLNSDQRVDYTIFREEG